MSTTIKIYCPKCGAAVEVDESAADGVLCQGCGYDFAEAAPLERTVVPAPQLISTDTLRRGHQTTRARAESFEVWSVLACVGAFLLLIAGGFLLSVGSEWGIVMLSIAGAVMGLAGWLYLMAQIIHIRANTEK
jgi:rubredoxin